jgi:hypothetical protein
MPLFLSKEFGSILQWDSSLNNVSFVSLEVIINPCKYVLVFLDEIFNFPSFFTKVKFSNPDEI